MNTEEEQRQRAHLRKISEKISHDQREHATDAPERQAESASGQVIRHADLRR